MQKLKISLIACPGIPSEIFEEAEKKILNIIEEENIHFTDENPDVLVVLTGGSEAKAKELIEKGNSVLIIAETANNSYAAATEIKSYYNKTNINTILINTDFDDLSFYLNAFFSIKMGMKRLNNYKLGLIGNPSPWLINSTIDNKTIKEKIGVNIENVQWNEIDDFQTQQINTDFNNNVNFPRREQSLSSRNGRTMINTVEIVINKFTT